MKKQYKSKTKVALILSKFPDTYETFLLREIVEFKKTDIELFIFSLKRCKDKIIHPTAKKFMKETFYSNFFFSWKVFMSNLYFICKKPFEYIITIYYILWNNLKSPNFLIKSFILFPESVYFAKIIKEKKINIVHGYWVTFPATSAIIISRLIGIPFSMTGHAHDIYLDTTMLIEKMKKARFIATCTAHNKIYLMNLTKNKLARQEKEKLKNKIFVNYHGINLGRFKRNSSTNISKSAKISSNPFKILTVGSLIPCKGIDIVIKACNILKEDGFVNYHCTIVGGGSLHNKLSNLIKKFDLQKHIKMTGDITQDKLIPYYKTADVFALPVRLDIHWGIPNVLLEAVAAKVLVITTGLPSIPELIINGKTGYIIPEKNPEALADVIKKVIKHPKLHEQIINEAYKVVKTKYVRRQNAKKLVKLFQQYSY